MRLFGGIALLVLATFMLLGFLGSSLSIGSPSVIAALLLVVVLPGVAGVALLKPGLFSRGRLEAGRAEIRQRTLESEVLRLARRHDGRLTIVEVVTELAITADEAKTVLDSLALKGMADFAVTDAGVVVYDFRDVRGIADKSSARGILDA